MIYHCDKAEERNVIYLVIKNVIAGRFISLVLNGFGSVYPLNLR